MGPLPDPKANRHVEGLIERATKVIDTVVECPPPDPKRQFGAAPIVTFVEAITLITPKVLGAASHLGAP
jgi:hypothetical protein